MEFSVRTPGHASRSEVIASTSFFYNWGTVFNPWMKKALELVDGYLGYLGAKLSVLPLVTSPYYSKHVTCTLQQLSVGRADVNRRGRGGTQRLADSF
jgi:hypothetical protein